MMLDIRNTFATKNYWYGALLRDLKHLDIILTNYLVDDEYSGEKEREEDIITYIKVLNDATDYILNNVLEEQDNYFKGDYEKRFNNVKNIHNAWKELNIIKSTLENGYKDIYIQFDKGFNFGFANRNFTNLDIYKRYHQSNCNTSILMIGVSTHSGNTFRVYVSNEYIQEVYPDIKGDASISNKKIEMDKSFNNKEDTLGYIIELIQELVYE